MARTNDGQMIPIYCQHCEQAHCMKVCNRGALMRDRDGAVVLQPMLCRGCETRNCVIACPYAAFFATDRGLAPPARKCAPAGPSALPTAMNWTSWKRKPRARPATVCLRTSGPRSSQLEKT